MWNCPCASLCNTCGVSPSDACHKICAPATGAPFALTTSPSNPPGFCLADLGTCARASADTNAAAHTSIPILRRVRLVAVRLRDRSISQYYMEKFNTGLPDTRTDARMIRGASERNRPTLGANRKGRNPGTPISRLASCKPPIGRLAFPGSITRSEGCFDRKIFDHLVELNLCVGALFF